MMSDQIPRISDSLKYVRSISNMYNFWEKSYGNINGWTEIIRLYLRPYILNLLAKELPLNLDPYILFSDLEELNLNITSCKLSKIDNWHTEAYCLEIVFQNTKIFLKFWEGEEKTVIKIIVEPSQSITQDQGNTVILVSILSLLYELYKNS